jgi:hypothetical protein
MLASFLERENGKFPQGAKLEAFAVIKAHILI